MLKAITLAAVFTALAASLAACNSEEQQTRLFVNVTAHKLKLSDQQKARLYDVASTAIAFHGEMTKDEKQLKQELLAMFHADKLDTARINQLLNEKEQVFKKHSRLLVADIAEFHSTLTPSQKEQILELVEKGQRRNNCKCVAASYPDI